MPLGLGETPVDVEEQAAARTAFILTSDLGLYNKNTSLLLAELLLSRKVLNIERVCVVSGNLVGSQDKRQMAHIQESVGETSSQSVVVAVDR